MRVVRRMGGDGLWDSNVRFHRLILLQRRLIFQQVLQIALERFWQGARHPLHLLPVVISGMEHPKAQVLNGAVGMTPPGYSSVLLLVFSCPLFVFVCNGVLALTDLFLGYVPQDGPYAGDYRAYTRTHINSKV